jgi:hypothetical protein
MNIAEIIESFSKIDISDFPDFFSYDNPLEMGLWVLWVAKEKLNIKKLSAEQIASIIRDVKEISIDARSITNSFNPAKKKIHSYKVDGETYFEIMKPGKDYLLSLTKEGYIEVFYFEPGKPYSNKRIVSKEILNTLKGELKIVDPYCDIKTLDILKEVKNATIKFLSRTDNLKDKKARFLRQLQDFKAEHLHVEVRDYPYDDIHDRYILSSEGLILLGHSIKDLGNKESFAISLNKKAYRNLIEAIIENFGRRWEQSKPL